jgi:hypothetical protein
MVKNKFEPAKRAAEAFEATRNLSPASRAYNNLFNRDPRVALAKPRSTLGSML